MKTCNKCKIEKHETEFGKCKKTKDGLHSTCKECRNKAAKDKYENDPIHREKIIKQVKDKYQNNNEHRENIKQQRRERRKNDEEYRNKLNQRKRNKLNDSDYKENYYRIRREKYQNNEEFREKRKMREREKYKTNEEYRQKRLLEKREKYKNDENFREKLKQQEKKYKTSPKGIKARKRNRSTIEYKMVELMRSFIKRILKYKNDNFKNKDLGYTKHELKEHLEKQFNENMSWCNYGTWHVDHIIPITKFDVSVPTYIINHLENLQPLDGSENMSKGNNIPLIPEISIAEYVLVLNENNKYQLK